MGTVFSIQTRYEICVGNQKPKKPPVENEDPAYFCMSGLSPDRLQVTPDSRTLLISQFRVKIEQSNRSWKPTLNLHPIFTRNGSRESCLIED